MFLHFFPFGKKDINRGGPVLRGGATISVFGWCLRGRARQWEEQKLVYFSLEERELAASVDDLRTQLDESCAKVAKLETELENEQVLRMQDKVQSFDK